MKKKLTVKGMHCESCEVLIKDALLEVDGVKSAQVSRAKNSVEVEFDEKKVSEQKIKDIIKQEGYDAK